MRAVVLLLALLPCLALGLRSRAAEVQLYRVQARPAAELAALIDPLLAPDGAAVADASGGFVLLRGPAEAISQALELLRTLDVPLRQYRIETELASRAVLAARGWTLEGWIRVGDLQIGRAATPEGGARISVDQLRADSGRQFQATVVALEGQPAEIWTGALFPFRVHSYAVDRPHSRHPGSSRVLETTAWAPVRQGVRVRARSSGEAVELDLVPVIEEGHPEGGIRELGAATRIRVMPGERLVVGALEREAGTAWAEPLGREGLGAQTGDLLLVRVERIDEAAPLSRREAPAPPP